MAGGVDAQVTELILLVLEKLASQSPLQLCEALKLLGEEARSKQKTKEKTKFPLSMNLLTTSC